MVETWKERLTPTSLKTDPYFDVFRDVRERRLKRHAEATPPVRNDANALSALANYGLYLALHQGVACATAELEPLAHTIRATAIAYVDRFGSEPDTGMLHVVSDVCIFQCLGIRIGDDPLPAL